MPVLRRKSIRLPGYDYSTEGSYFITIVTKDRRHLFGEVVNGEVVLNGYGSIVEEEWARSAAIRKEIELDEYVIMPNHFHAIVHIIPTSSINDNHRTGDRPVAPTNPIGPKPKSLGALMAGFKSAVTTRINTLRHTPGTPVWQRNYFSPSRKNRSGAQRPRT